MEIDHKALGLLPLELRAEIAENLHRKDFTPSELEEIRRTCTKAFEAEARKRQAAAGPTSGQGAKPSGLRNLSQSDPGRTTDKIGALFGVSGRTLERISAVVAAAESDPAQFGKLRERMDRTGRVNGVYKQLKTARQAAEIRKEPPPLPGNARYRVIVADPPWPYEARIEDPSHRAVTPYPQMSIVQICAMPVASIAHDDCVLWLWTTNLHMPNAFAVLDAWGFEHRTIMTWVKNRMGTGDWLRGQTEHCLMAGRGRPVIALTNQTTVLSAPARAHSEKPDEFYDLVESLCPAPRYAYLFSRKERRGWDSHGDEVGKRV